MRILVACLMAAVVAPSVSAADRRHDIVVAVNELPRGLEPVENTGNVDVRVTYSIFDTLIRRDFSVAGGGSASLKPSLAESWKRVSPTVLEVKLRRGVKFHNGDEFTADDVVFTFSPERMTGKDAVLPGGRQYFGHVKVEMIDPYTVRFVTEKPDIVLEQRLATYASWIVNRRQWVQFHKPDDKNWMQRALREVRWNPVGTGPLKFRDWKKDQYVAFTAHDNYFLGRPMFRSVVFKEVPETATRIAGLVSGEFDIIVDIAPDQYPVLARYKDINLHSVVLENSHVLVFNTNAPSLRDKRLRQALSLAIDRKKLRDALWQGRNYTPNGYQLQSFGPMYKADRAGYVYDPDRARHLVKESGYDGKTIGFRLIPNYYLNGLEVAQVLLEMWKAVGINVKLDLVDSFKQVRAPGVEIHAWSNTYRLPDPAGSINILYGPRSGMQKAYGFWNAPAAFNQAADTIATTTDLKERHSAFQHMLDIMEDEMPMTILYNPLVGYASTRHLDWKPSPLYFIDFRPDVFLLK